MSDAAIQENSKSAHLLRELGRAQAVSVVVGVVIGSGIFLVPAEMMQAAGSARLVFLAWIVGGILSFFGAVTYSELGVMKPQAGGEYVYIRDAYGPLAGFLCGWTWTIVVKPSSLAAISTGIVQVLGSLAPLSFLTSGGTQLTFSGQIAATVVVFLICAVNYVGIRRAGNFQLIFTILKIVLIVVIATLAFTFHGSAANFRELYVGATGGLVGFILAVKAALWAYDGWSDLNMVAEEVRAPEKNIPFAMVTGMCVIATAYIVVNAAVQFVLPPAAVAHSSSPMSDAVRAASGGVGGAIVAVAIVISLLSSLNGVAMSGARMTFAMARDGNFFSALARVHARFHTPHVAIVVQGALAGVFLVLGGSFRQLFSLALFAEWLSYVTASSALIVFRVRDRQPERGFHFWGYPVAPALFILASGALLYYTFTSNLRYSLLGSLAIVAGIPVYYAFALRRNS